MAEVVIRQLVDDIDGSEIQEGGGERVNFALRGVEYQIDLSNSNVVKLEKAFKPYIAAAEKVGGPRQARRSKVKANGRTPSEQLAAIRDWARKNGYEVSDRGRIKGEILEAFQAAH